MHLLSPALMLKNDMKRCLIHGSINLIKSHISTMKKGMFCKFIIFVGSLAANKAFCSGLERGLLALAFITPNRVVLSVTDIMCQIYCSDFLCMSWWLMSTKTTDHGLLTESLFLGHFYSSPNTVTKYVSDGASTCSLSSRIKWRKLFAVITWSNKVGRLNFFGCCITTHRQLKFHCQGCSGWILTTSENPLRCKMLSTSL